MFPIAKKKNIEFHAENNDIVPVVCFADDSALTLSIPDKVHRPPYNAFLEFFSTLGEVTGLQIQPTKSEILIINGPIDDSATNYLQNIGKISTSVRHLGVQVSTDIAQSCALSYQKVIDKIEKAPSKIANSISNSDLFIRKTVAAALIQGSVRYLFRVFSPDKDTLKKIWTKQIDCLWTVNKDSRSFKHTKVAASRIQKPYELGGLKISHPEQAVLASFMSAYHSIHMHCFIHPKSIINSILELNSFKPNTEWMHMNVTQAQHMEESLELTFHNAPWHNFKKFLRFLETDPFSYFQAPTWNNSASLYLHGNPNNIRWHTPRSDIQNFSQFIGAGGQFNSISSLWAQKTLHHKRFWTPSILNPKLEISGIDNEKQKMCKAYFRNLHSNLLKTLPSDLLADRIAPTSHTSITWTMKSKEISGSNSISNGLHRFFNSTSGPHPSTAPAYFTRVSDGEDVPHDPKLFSQALSIIHKTRIPEIVKNIAFACLTRTYPSPRKLYNMKILDDVNKLTCPPCNMTANLFHCSVDCILPTTFLLIFQKFQSFNADTAWLTQDFDVLQLYFTFPYPHKSISLELLSTWITLWTWIKSASVQLHIHDDYRIGNFRFPHILIQIMRAIRLTQTAAHRFHISECWINSFSDFVSNNYDQSQQLFQEAMCKDRLRNINIIP